MQILKFGSDNMSLKTIDLFAGIGGIRRGFEMTGKFQNVMSAEIDKYACVTYEHLYGENPHNDVSSDEFKKKVENTNYDVLLAGFPCQAFSIAGKKLGFRDSTRGTLFFDIADIIEKTKPKTFLLENVEGLINHNKGKTFNIIIETLVNDLGYKIVGVEEGIGGYLKINKEEFIRNTKNFGLPQKRSRVYIMGFRKDVIPEGYVFPSLPQRSTDVIYKNLYDVLQSSVDGRYYLSSAYLNTLKKHKSKHEGKGNGFGYIVVNEGENPISNTILATGGSGKERNLVKQKNYNMGGKVIKNKKSELNNEGIRHMTPIEWGKLQGFIGYGFKDGKKDGFSFPKEVSITQQYKLFGNSVSIPVIENMAKYMYDRLEEINAI